MIWRIIGIIGAGSFFVNGFNLLSNPTCVSADFGGGRVIQVTCRSDSYGTFSGTEAGLISFFIGSVLLILIFFSQLRKFFNKPSIPSEWKNVSISNSEELVDIKICTYCEGPVSLDLQKCPLCEGTYFNYKKVWAAARVSPETKVEVNITENQIKKCPMCAENIRIEALKCRFCGESFVPKKNSFLDDKLGKFSSLIFSKRNWEVKSAISILLIIGLAVFQSNHSRSVEIARLMKTGNVCVNSDSANLGCGKYPYVAFNVCLSKPYLYLSVRENSVNLTPSSGIEWSGVKHPYCSSFEPYLFQIVGNVKGAPTGNYSINGYGGDTLDFDLDFKNMKTLNLEIKLPAQIKG